MHRLIYASRAAEATDRGDLRDILAVSREQNPGAGVTGHLLYSGTAFLQVLEGDEAAVRATFARIAVDHRHTEVRVLVDEATPSRAFGTWAMGFAFLDGDDLPGTTSLRPDALAEPAAAEQLLLSSADGEGRASP